MATGFRRAPVEVNPSRRQNSNPFQPLVYQAATGDPRALQGLGEALEGPATLSNITVLFSDQKDRNTALSILGRRQVLSQSFGQLETTA